MTLCVRIRNLYERFQEVPQDGDIQGDKAVGIIDLMGNTGDERAE
jgi:hypothetical protein